MTPTLSTQILKMNQLGAPSRAIACETFMKHYETICRNCGSVGHIFTGAPFVGLRSLKGSLEFQVFIERILPGILHW